MNFEHPTLQGVTNERALTLRLPWARRCCPFRAHLLNPKLELLKNHKQ